MADCGAGARKPENGPGRPFGVALTVSATGAQVGEHRASRVVAASHVERQEFALK
jgi:hypothetical protein